MNLDELTSWLYGRTTGGIKWGLDTTRALLAGGGDPHRRFHSLHIGGTNGKGSVSALCAAALLARGGGRVGLYTSPHLVSFTERIRIDGEPVAAEAVMAAARRLEPLIEETGASFFEATTAIAFLCFADAGVETVVAEVGLGGRLDATNVLTPLVTAVTNVALDHVQELGASLPSVAVEKAGIFKTWVPAITAEEDEDVLEVLAERAHGVGAPFHLLDDRATVTEVETDLEGTRFTLDSRSWGHRRLRVSLPGAHQARNAALAAETLALLPREVRPTWEAVEHGFAAARWPGRFQVERIRGTTWILDVAHNPAGAGALASALDAVSPPRPLVAVIGILSDKAWQEMLPPLLARCDGVILTTAASAPVARRWDPEVVGRWVREQSEVTVRVIPELPAALARAATLAPHGTVLVTGSVHTVGDALAELGVG
ncbi:MAG TPA: Mur ligase family protein [Longimicrobiaceae bacterium]